MRKLCILVAILLFTAVAAHAEYDLTITGTLDEFDIRNGIQFFMTKDDVIEKEELDTDDSKYSMNKNHLDIGGSLAGIANASGEYIFNDENKLIAFEYYFGGPSILEQKPLKQILSEYDYIEKALSEKYGNATEKYCAIISDYFDSYIDYNKSQKDAQLLQPSERLLKIASGGYVKIEHWAGVNNVQSVEHTAHYVYYTYFSDEDIDRVSAMVNEKEAQKNNDL